jgi:hypothetical protein
MTAFPITDDALDLDGKVERLGKGFMVTSDGLMKILEFGLAKRTPAVSQVVTDVRSGRLSPASCWEQCSTGPRSRPGRRRWATARTSSRWG